MKQMLYLMAIRATSMECEWASIYQHLLPRLAIYDERTKDYRGKLKVIGRIAGQMASMIFALLRRIKNSSARCLSARHLHLPCSPTQPYIGAIKKDITAR
jgi:hypothetical protein